MINIKVSLKSFLKVKIGLPEIELSFEDLSTVYDVAVKVGEIYGEEIRNYLIDRSTGKVNMIFTCNKKMCTKDQVVNEGDVIAIFPPLAGG